MVDRLLAMCGPPGRTGTCTPTAPCGEARRALASGTHLHSSDPLRDRLREEFGETRFADLTVEFQCCAASVERAA